MADRIPVWHPFCTLFPILRPGPVQIQATAVRVRRNNMHQVKNKQGILMIGLFIMLSMMVTAQADLQIEITCPGNAVPGQELGKSIKVWVKNTGNQAAGQFAVDLVLSKTPAVPVKFATYSPNYSDDVLLQGGREHVPSLNPGQRVEVTLNGNNKIPADTPDGLYFLGAVVDPGKAVSERKERNNVATCRMVIRRHGDDPGSRPARKPDLIVSDIRLVDNCKISVTLKNIGHAAVPDDQYNLPKAVGVQMYVDGSPWGGIILSGFDPDGHLKHPGGSASWIWFPNAANLNLSPGNHLIKVEVDNNKTLDEEREDNNIMNKRVSCQNVGQEEPPMSVPQRFFLDFVDAYLVHEPGGVLQIATEQMVLSYGSDWERVQVKPYLFHLRLKTWQGFYWLVNTDRKELYRVNGTHFGSIGDASQQKLNCVVDVVGGGMSPTRFFLRFKGAYLVFVPGSKSLQIAAYQNVLSYGGDWQGCQIKPYLYDLKQNVWQGFHWKINTSRKQAFKITSGSFCHMGGSENQLQMGVRVVE